MERATEEWESHVARHVKLRDLHILSTVVQWGSMAKAAPRLSMSQPAVSQSIANLEAALGVRLLDRSTRGIEPTGFALVLLKRSRVAFDELGQAVRDVRFLATSSAGEIRVAAGDTLAAGLLPAVIDQLSRRHPRIVIRVIQANAEMPQFRELRERRVDLALARISRSFVEDDLDVEILFEDPHRVVVGARNPLAGRRKVALEELANEPWIFTSNQVIRELIAEAFSARGLALPQETVSSNSILLRNHLLATGRFLTVLPVSVLRYNARQWSLKVLPVDLGVKPRCVAILMLKNRTASPVVQLFAQFVRAAVKTM